MTTEEIRADLIAPFRRDRAVSGWLAGPIAAEVPESTRTPIVLLIEVVRFGSQTRSQAMRSLEGRWLVPS